MIKEMMRNGAIVPAAVTVGLLLAAMKKGDKNKFLIDGFPRNEENNRIWHELVRVLITGRLARQSMCLSYSSWTVRIR
jgi:UMP-CMP kinase